ncbi:VirB3 family type IV secretion system protein [Asticcacaulis sp. W401b]|uniref:VirB3 family type IV secretion system protein n=1 Tax=Asticcacaulis sp. W401b TaxID=3388666 RepID=UPI003970636B
MSIGSADNGVPPAYAAPVYRALIEPILMAGAPRALAIVNGTVAAALGLGLRLWVAGLVLGLIGHALAVWAARKDPDFVEVARCHIRLPSYFDV